jgi:hypothetical protein
MQNCHEILFAFHNRSRHDDVKSWLSGVQKRLAAIKTATKDKINLSIPLPSEEVINACKTTSSG